jgi:hypothetical protein
LIYYRLLKPSELKFNLSLLSSKEIFFANLQRVIETVDIIYQETVFLSRN